MSILLKEEIKDLVKTGKIHINPYNEDQVGPNSYDVKLGSKIVVYKSFPLNLKTENQTEVIEIPPEGLLFNPNTLYLASTVEEVGSDFFIPMYEGRSSMARLGIQSHISAGFGDVGFKSQWTLEITVVHPIIMYPGVKIGQIYFHQINQEANLGDNRYLGKYKNQAGPTASKSYLDYES